MTSFCEISLPETVPDDADELFLHPVNEGLKTPATEVFDSLRGWFEWFIDQSTLSALPRRKADKVDVINSKSALYCHRFQGLFAVARGNLIVIGRKENIAQPNTNSIVLNQNHFQGVIRDLCWTNDMQCTLLISTKVGVFLNTFPEEHAAFVSDYHHIIDTQFIAYLPEIEFVYNLSPSPHGRFIVCIGRSRDGSDHMLHLDTSFNTWHYISLQKPYSGTLVYYPYHVYEYQQSKNSLMKSITSIEWSSNGSTVILLCRGEVITIETYRWLRQSTVAYANLINFSTFTRLNDTSLLSFVSSFSGSINQIEANAFLVEPLTYADGSSISSIRSARSLKLDMQQALTVKEAVVSSDGNFICLSYVVNIAEAREEPKLVDFPCLDVFAAAMDNDNAALNMSCTCSAYRFGTNTKQMAVTHPEKWQTPKSFSFCQKKGSGEMQLLVLWSDMAVTYHDIPLN